MVLFVGQVMKSRTIGVAKVWLLAHMAALFCVFDPAVTAPDDVGSNQYADSGDCRERGKDGSECLDHVCTLIITAP